MAGQEYSNLPRVSRFPFRHASRTILRTHTTIEPAADNQITVTEMQEGKGDLQCHTKCIGKNNMDQFICIAKEE